MAQERNEGRRRLALLMSATSGALCALAMIVVLVVYGTPYNPVWWGVMAAILVAAVLVPRALVPAVEWVIDGYRDARE